MTKILEKIESEVICIIDDKQYQYTNGKEAYQQLTNNYSIITVCLDQAQQAAGVCVYGRHAGRKSRDCRSPVPAGGIF